MFRPPVRRVFLLVHVAVAVGWMGAATAYVSMGVVAVTSTEPEVQRAAYLMMWPVAAFAITPLAVATLVTGIVQSLGTPWGLFRHYWVVISLVTTVFATVVLLLHLPAVRALADVASQADVDLAGRGGDLFHAIAGLVVLAVPLTLNVVKPRGLTTYGWRRQQASDRA